MGDAKAEAARTAAERLEAIERWSRRTFIAAAIAAAMLGLLTAMVGYVGWDYLRLKSAAEAGVESWNRQTRERDQRTKRLFGIVPGEASPPGGRPAGPGPVF